MVRGTEEEDAFPEDSKKKRMPFKSDWASDMYRRAIETIK